MKKKKKQSSDCFQTINLLCFKPLADSVMMGHARSIYHFSSWSSKCHPSLCGSTTHTLIRFYNAFSLSDWSDKQDISTAVRDNSHQCLAAWVGSNKTPLLLCPSLPTPANQKCLAVKVSFETVPRFWFRSRPRRGRVRLSESESESGFIGQVSLHKQGIWLCHYPMVVAVTTRW